MAEALGLERPRPQRRRAALVGIVFQYLSVALTVLQGFVLLPLTLAHVDKSLYGAWLATGNVLLWLSIVDPGTARVMSQRVGEEYGRGDFRALEGAVGTGLAVNTLLAAAFAILGLAASRFVPGWVNASGSSAGTLALCFALAALAEGVLMGALGFAAVVMALMRFPIALGVLYSLGTLTGFACTIGFLLRDWGLLAIPAGLMVRAALLLCADVILCGLVVVRSLRLRPRVDRFELRRILGLTSTTWLSRLGGTLFRNLDGLVVARFVGPAAVTSMVASRRAIDVVGQLTSRVGSAFAPGIAHLAGEADVGGLFTVSTRLVRLVAWLGALGMGGFVALNHTFVRLWVGADLYAGDAASVLFGLLGFWLGMQALLSEATFAAGRIRAASLTLLLESLLGAGFMLVAAAGGAGLLSPAIGGLAAAAGVTVWIWSRLFARAFGLGPGQGARLLRDVVLQVASALALGFAWHRIAPPSHGWIGFSTQAVAFVLLELAVSLALSSPLRGEAHTGLLAARAIAWRGLRRKAP